MTALFDCDRSGRINGHLWPEDKAMTITQPARDAAAQVFGYRDSNDASRNDPPWLDSVLDDAAKIIQRAIDAAKAEQREADAKVADERAEGCRVAGVQGGIDPIEAAILDEHLSECAAAIREETEQ